MTKQIQLTQGYSTTVDDDDYDFLMQWKWCFVSNGYAVRLKTYYKFYGKLTPRMIRMHRVINDTPNGLFTDHLNGDKLDNRKSNLRSCTKSQNSMNRKGYKNTSSKFKGVTSRNNKWEASIKIDKKSKTLGRFTSEKEAAKAYNVAALKYHGEFAKLNIIV